MDTAAHVLDANRLSAFRARSPQHMAGRVLLWNRRVQGLKSCPVLPSAPMPFKSQAQRRKFAQLLVEGKISNETFEEWNRETGGQKLPERVKRTATTGTRRKATKPAKRRTTPARKTRQAAKKR
jgi:hypothetical protein